MTKTKKIAGTTTKNTKKNELVLTATEKTAFAKLSLIFRKISKVQVKNYYQFAREWNKAFPKKSKAYQRGTQIVKLFAEQTGVSVNTVYAILQVTNFLPEKEYLKLEQEAAKNNVIIRWTTLRLLHQKFHVNRDGMPEMLKIITKKQVSESQCHALMDLENKNKRKQTGKKYGEGTPMSMYIAFGDVCVYTDNLTKLAEEAKGNKKKEIVLRKRLAGAIQFFDDITETINSCRKTVSDLITEYKEKPKDN